MPWYPNAFAATTARGASDEDNSFHPTREMLEIETKR